MPSCDITLKTPQNPPEGPVSKVVSSPGSIPHSLNYFDAISEMEEDIPLEEKGSSRDGAHGDPKDLGPQ